MYNEYSKEPKFFGRRKGRVVRKAKSFLLEKADADASFKKMLQRVNVNCKIIELDENNEELSYILLSN